MQINIKTPIVTIETCEHCKQGKILHIKPYSIKAPIEEDKIVIPKYWLWGNELTIEDQNDWDWFEQKLQKEYIETQAYSLNSTLEEIQKKNHWKLTKPEPMKWQVWDFAIVTIDDKTGFIWIHDAQYGKHIATLKWADKEKLDALLFAINQMAN